MWTGLIEVIKHLDEYITSMKPRLEGSSFNMLKNNYSFRGDTEFAWRFEDQIAKQLRKRDF